MNHMKGKILVFLFLLTGLASAQTNSFPATGSVGVGTLTPESTGSYSIVDLVGKSVSNGGYISFSTSNSSGKARIFNTHERLLFDLRTAGMYFQWRNSDSKQIYRLNSDGSAVWNGNSSGYTEVASNTNGQYIRQFANNGTTQSWLIRGYASSGVQAEFNSGGVNVNGTVKAKEVNVTASGWADYVFQDEYDLMPLSELKKYVIKNRHLPNIPTETEVLENGVNLSEINVKLLGKVEELTLYTIQQENLINSLLERMEALEKEVRSLKGVENNLKDR